jgi:3-deoxy-D-manno-octulosonate 8-phosphate phosphatase (KDO 8-P phosphatase)
VAVPLPQAELLQRARSVEALVLDVDGVLTDASIIYGPRGEESKSFFARDGFALKLAASEGIAVAILSGRPSPATQARLADLGVPAERIVLGSRDKRADVSLLAARIAAPLERIAFMGDDIPDLPALAAVGLAACPADAADEVKRRCHFVAAAPGGRGAVRDLVRLVLETRGRWAELVESWWRDAAPRGFFAAAGDAPPARNDR